MGAEHNQRIPVYASDYVSTGINDSKGKEESFLDRRGFNGCKSHITPGADPRGMR